MTPERSGGVLSGIAAWNPFRDSSVDCSDLHSRRELSSQPRSSALRIVLGSEELVTFFDQLSEEVVSFFDLGKSNSGNVEVVALLC